MDNINRNSLTKQIQILQLEMLEEFRRICDKYHLRWFAIGGTCLGAVRHQGFIPWDDDIDVAMPFEDYETFRNVAEKELNEPFAFHNPHKERETYNLFLKIHNTQTAFIHPNDLPYPYRYMGVSFDIMPLYGLPSSPFKRSVRVVEQKMWLRANHIMRFEGPHASTKRMKPHMKVLSLLISRQKKTKPFDYYLTKIERELGKYPFDRSTHIIVSANKS